MLLLIYFHTFPQNTPQITPSQQPIITSQPQPHKAQIVNQPQGQQIVVTQKQPPALISTSSNNQMVASNQQIIQGGQQIIQGNQQLIQGGQQMIGGNQQIIQGNQQLLQVKNIMSVPFFKTNMLVIFGLTNKYL